ncbi:leucine-rich repeat containing protein [Nannochloropsis gaditana]|uniref:Leucine-rich repeat containing protein n=1 Tax=Nannochloropsis gaditana TaxID=72520 RepID=W7TJA0_9STRA|nr:leucine-rich repeat containing protein [Nannochloropsis gaditana]
MPEITRDLLRKRAEHNEGILTTLEELALHQEELEGINDILGKTCREIKILYLQNNLLPRIENLHHLKCLEYLNVALNNISVVEGLGSCEFLRKLDLTVNFIDFDALEASITHLASLRHLRDLYFLGNPAQTRPWFEDEEVKCEAVVDKMLDKKQAFTYYIAHRLPQLQCLDGQEITRTTRLLAARVFPTLETRLRVLATRTRCEKEGKAKKAIKDTESCASSGPVENDGTDGSMPTSHDPETRRAIYLEIAAQKKEKLERQRADGPKKRDTAREQAVKLAQVQAEEAGQETRPPSSDQGLDSSLHGDQEARPRQKNEGKWPYTLLDHDDRTATETASAVVGAGERDAGQWRHWGCVVLDLALPRHLDSSLLDVDVHPYHINVIAKGKLLRLHLPEEVRVSHSRAIRSKTTGHLQVVMPKLQAKKTRQHRTSAPPSSCHVPSPSAASHEAPLRSSSPGSQQASASTTLLDVRRQKRNASGPRLSLIEEMLAASKDNIQSPPPSSVRSSSLPPSPGTLPSASLIE